MIEIFHVSDLHFGKKTVQARRLLSKVREKFKIGEAPNTYLLVTGDITDSGTRKQYEMALRALSAFKKDSVYIVPGNHDYEGLGILYNPQSARRFDSALCGRLGIDHRFFAKKPFSKVLDDKEGSRVLIIGLNSCSKRPLFFDFSEGEIGGDQRKELGTTISARVHAKTPKIVFLHHVPHKRSTGIFMRLRDYKELMGVIHNRVDALLFGHTGAMEDIGTRDINKLEVSGREKAAMRTAKRDAPSGREIKLRSGKGQSIKYYLDANRTVEDQACYHIKVEKDNVTARLKRL